MSTLSANDFAGHTPARFQPGSRVHINGTHLLGTIVGIDSTEAAVTLDCFKDKSIKSYFPLESISPAHSFPPVGFTPVYDDNELNFFEGPKASADSITVESFWNEGKGIEFHVTNDSQSDNGIFSMEELTSLPSLITKVVSEIRLEGGDNA